MIKTTLGGDEVLIHETDTLDVGQFRQAVRQTRLLGLDCETLPLDHEDELNDFGPLKSRFLRLVQFATETEAWNLDPSRPSHRQAILDTLSDPRRQLTTWTSYDPIRLTQAFGVDVSRSYWDAQTLSLLLKPGEFESHKLKEWAARYGMPELRAAEEDQKEYWKTLEVRPPRKPVKPRVRKAETEDQYAKRLYDWHTRTIPAWRQKVEEYYREYPLMERARETKTGGYASGWSGWRDVPLSDHRYQKYAGLDALAVRRLWPLLVEACKEAGVYGALPVELELQQVVGVRQHIRGVKADREYAERIYDEVAPKHHAARAKFTDLTGIPAGSSKRVEWLADRGVRWREHEVTDSGAPSLASKIVGDLIARHAPGTGSECDPEAWEALNLIKEASETQNLTTFAGGILRMIDPDGWLHPNYRVLGAKTGRWSVTRPGAQTFSNRNGTRGILTPDSPDDLLASIDQSQIEVRVFAALSQDPKLMAAFNEGRDLYDSVAISLFGPGFTKMDRSICKRIILGGVLYAGGPDTLQSQLYNLDGYAVPREKIVETRADFWELYPVGTKWNRGNNGPQDVWLESGRRVPGDPDREYKRTNSFCQGTARDILMQTLRRTWDKGYEDLARLDVHDEVLFSVPKAEAPRILADLHSCFTVTYKGVQLGADIEVHPERWGGPGFQAWEIKEDGLAGPKIKKEVA